EMYDNCHEMTSSDFAHVAFRTVLGQMQTGLRHAFLQQGVTDPDLRKHANALWRSFSDTYDTIEEISGSTLDRTLPLSGRALVAIHNSEFPDLQDTTARIISGVSSFGIKFRKATENEAIAYVKGIQAFSKASVSNWRLNALGRHLGLDVSGGTIEAKISVIGDRLRGSDPYDVNDGNLVEAYAKAHVTEYQTELEAAFDHEVNVIKRAFFKPSHKHLDPDKARHLFRHQLKCTVVALYDFSYEGYWLGHQRFSNTGDAMYKDKIFEFIDETLMDTVPKGEAVNSRALFQNVKDHLGNSKYLLD
ncbi:MAG: hypothetical protein K2Q34_07175, partial [Alphaproteobacteria bacterium]|nr:hypothetical protein [Alphaproteobacteria bacterium]